jgi:hypothetical protein
MTKNILAIAAVGLMAAPLVSNAAPISFGALSSDDSGSTQIISDSLNNYEWLRWDVLSGFTLEQTLAATSAGGLYQGWQIARNNEAQLFTNAWLQGLDNACTTTNSDTCSMLLPSTLTDLFGDTLGSTGTSEDVGFLSDAGADVSGFIQYTHEGDSGSAFKSNDGGDLARTGWLLYRVAGSEGPPPASVPEPGTLALFAAGFAGIGVMRRRKLAAQATA